MSAQWLYLSCPCCSGGEDKLLLEVTSASPTPRTNCASTHQPWTIWNLDQHLNLNFIKPKGNDHFLISCSRAK